MIMSVIAGRKQEMEELGKLYLCNRPESETTIMMRLKIFLIFAILCMVAQGAWAWNGNGTEANPYQISSVDDWNTLCANVNNGTSTYSGKFFKLMADITVEETFSTTPTKMVGCSENLNFRGAFDGNGYTITVKYVDNNDEDYSAPFRYIRNATIKNLHVAGSITKTKKRNAGGLVGVAFGTCHISNCRSSVEIIFNVGGDCSSGGFIGELGTSSDADDTYIDNCLFDGKLTGSSAYSWGGFVGWVENEPDVYINNSLFNPALVNVNNSDNKTFARGGSDDVHIKNCYHKNTLMDAQGSTVAEDMDNETLRMKLGDAWENIGGQVQPIMIPFPLDGSGTQDSPYRISSIDDWNKFATNVYLGEGYNGACFLMTQDISVSRMVGTRSSGGLSMHSKALSTAADTPLPSTIPPMLNSADLSAIPTVPLSRTCAPQALSIPPTPMPVAWWDVTAQPASRSPTWSAA